MNIAKGRWVVLLVLSAAIAGCGGGGDTPVPANSNGGISGSNAPPPSGPTDSSAPTVLVTSPSASGAISVDTATITLSGTASDNVGVTQVRWAVGSAAAANASGTSQWSTGAIALNIGANAITITAVDAAGNVGTTQVIVTYSPAAQYAFSWDQVSDSRVTGYAIYYAALPFASASSVGRIAVGKVGSYQFTRAALSAVGFPAGSTAYMAVAAVAVDATESPLSDTASVAFDL